MSQAKNVVIGTAIGYTTDQIKNFVLSFREYNRDDDVVMFIDQNSLEQSELFFEVFNIKPILFDSLLYIQSISSTMLAFNSRFIRSYEFLYSKSEYDKVFMADVRDIVFQHDPFENLPEEFLYFFSDDNNLAIENNIYNGNWVYKSYPEIWDQLRKLPIICCGTIMGSRKQMMDCLKYIHHELLVLSQNNPADKTALVDQAVAIYIAYTYPLDILPRTIKENGDLVGTIGINCTTEFTLDRPRDIVTFDMGKVYINQSCPAVIHQYDRNQFLSDFFNNYYTINKRLN